MLQNYIFIYKAVLLKTYCLVLSTVFLLVLDILKEMCYNMQQIEGDNYG